MRVCGRAAPSNAVSRNSIPLIYIDHRALTRDCISRELAALLPEFAVESFSGPLEIARAPLPGHPGCIICHVHSLCVESQPVVDVLNALSDLFDGAAIIVLSDLEVTENIVEIMRFGVRAYIATSLPLRATAEAVRLVHAGYLLLPADARSTATMSVPPTNGSAWSGGSAHLTPRQLDVLKELCEGKQNKTIAYQLRMSEGTVKAHVKHMMKKMHTHNRTQLVLAMQRTIADARTATDRARHDRET